MVGQHARSRLFELFRLLFSGGWPGVFEMLLVGIVKGSPAAQELWVSTFRSFTEALGLTRKFSFQIRCESCDWRENPFSRGHLQVGGLEVAGLYTSVLLGF